MTDFPVSNQAFDQPALYQIRVRGHLDKQWSAWFEGLSIVYEAGGDTLISGWVADQPALYGLLKKVRDLGLVLVAVNQGAGDQAEA